MNKTAEIKIKVISFDLDGTLVKKTFADLVWLEGLPKIYAEEKNISIEKAKQYLKKEYNKIGENKPEWYDLKFWFKHFNLKHDWKKLLNHYRYAIEKYPDTTPTLEELRKKYNLIIASNAKREFIEIELKEAHIKKFFTHIFSSTSDFNKVKKLTSFYSMICNKLEINPDEMIHIGDHIEFDYHIPKRIGITSYYLDRKKTTHGEFIVHNLLEFKEKIRKNISH